MIYTVAVLVVACAARTAAVCVQTPMGQICGRTSDNVDFFLGIPYAEAPINQLRWRAPVPVAETPSRIINATAFGLSCIQFPSQPHVETSEDCLFINVYRPYGASKLEYVDLLRTATRKKKSLNSLIL